MINFDAFYDRECDWCGKEYNQKKRKGQFCSDNCAKISEEVSRENKMREITNKNRSRPGARRRVSRKRKKS